MQTLFVCFTASVLVVGAAAPAASLPWLSVPATDTRLHLAVRLPPDVVLDSSKRWELADASGGGVAAIPAELALAPEADGTPAKSGQMLVATLPASARATGLRHWQVVEARPDVSRAAASFRMADVDDKSLGLWEGARPVLVYNHGVISKPDVPADRDRSTYLHPIYGLDGEVLTDDFPKDHYHHRGLFWAWPHVRMEGKNYDLWDLRGIEQRFERWLDRQSGAAAAVLGVENGWYVGEKKVMQERVWFTVYPASTDAQVLDVNFTWIPVDKPIALAGAEEKSYGGLTLRFAPRTGTVITTPLGNKTNDLAMTRLAWADLAARFAGASGPSGAAIFIAPEHPDYPPTWLTRHYGALCVGWPGVTETTFQPGQPIHCTYRIWIHRGSAASPELVREYQAYESSREVTWAKRSNER